MPPCYLPVIVSALVFPLALYQALHQDGPGWWLVAVSGALTVVGVIDMTQNKQALRRNYPLLAHFRYFFESIRPEIRQYFLEDDTVAAPFSRNQRSIVYQRAKRETDTRPFGTQFNVYR